MAKDKNGKEGSSRNAVHRHSPHDLSGTSDYCEYHKQDRTKDERKHRSKDEVKHKHTKQSSKHGGRDYLANYGDQPIKIKQEPVDADRSIYKPSTYSDNEGSRHSRDTVDKHKSSNRDVINVHDIKVKREHSREGYSKQECDKRKKHDRDHHGSESGQASRYSRDVRNERSRHENEQIRGSEIRHRNENRHRHVPRDSTHRNERNAHSQPQFKNESAEESNDSYGSSRRVKEKEKPNLKLTGKLAEETNTFRGVVIKYNEPVEARKPKTRWRLYGFKGEQELPMLPIHRQSAYLLGRDRIVADIPVDHPSCSKQHAALQFRLVQYERDDGTTGHRVRPYIIDLESSNGTFLNSKKIESKRYVELKEKDVLKFGFSSREYVLLHENSKDDMLADEDVGHDIAGE